MPILATTVFALISAKSLKYDTPVYSLDSMHLLGGLLLECVLARFRFPLLSFGESVTFVTIAMRLAVGSGCHCDSQALPLIGLCGLGLHSYILVCTGFFAFFAISYILLACF